MKNVLKTVLRISLASVLSMLVYLICSLPFVAALNDSNNSSVIPLICAVLANVAFSLFMVWVLYIKTGEESKVIREDYAAQSYDLRTDLSKCIAREKRTLFCIWGILAVVFFAFLVDLFVLQKEVFSAVAVLYWPLYPFFMYLSQAKTWLAPLIGMVQTPITYLAILLLFRKKWYQKWK